MRVHRLELAAFGPFRERQVVDLDALAHGGVFLLHGSTGAGKTSVLDAICYALYGRVPGARASVARLRSDHAEAAERPEVVCEFTVAPRRFEVTRSPSWDRPKKRGNGTTTEPARVVLRELTGDGWAVLSTRIDETAHLLDDVLGMGADQFTQLVLLPQGEFAAFLRADADTRRVVLEKLFGTDRFTAIQDWLREQRATIRGEVDLAYRRTAQLLAQAGQAAAATGLQPRIGTDGGPRRDADDGSGEGVHDNALTDPQAWQRRLRNGVEQARNEALAVQLQARDRRDRAEIAYDQGQAMAQLAAELEALTARQQALDTGRDAVAHDRERLARARRAQGLAPMLPALRTATERLARCATELDQAAAATAGESSPDRVREQLALLDVVARDVGELDRLRGEHRRRSAELDRQLDQLARRRRELSEGADDLSVRHLHAREQAARAKAAYLDLRERRLAGMAAELAGRLRRGEECRVCGSLEHPRPAAARADQVDAAQERAAQSAADAADATAAEVGARLAAATSGLAALDEVSHDGERSELAALARSADELGVRIARACAAVDGDATADVGPGAEAPAAEPTTSAVPDVDALRRALTRRLAAAQRLTCAVEASASAEAFLDQIRSAATDSARRAGFADLDAAVGAVVDESEQTRLERSVIAYQVEDESVHEQLTDERFVALHAGPAVPRDLGGLRHDLEQARLADQHATGRSALCENAASELDRLEAQLADHLADTAPTLATLREIDDLARCADGTGGDNTRRMSLAAYVLAARLEQVAAAASERLTTMSAGRYTLVHSDAAGRGRLRTGLALDVLDAWTGTRRETSSLSGGESFYTSLALALGLADVVAAEAGGVRIDTLFVDEGFGSLDEDTLDEVMDVLDGLRSGGRTVGVVSHLAEMRQRIPVRLEVTKTPNGSALTAYSA